MTEPFERKVLDHGYLKVCEVWGSDEMIVESARMSTGKGFLGWGTGRCEGCNGSGRQFVDEGWPDAICERCEGKGARHGDEKLLRFLYENRHSTPFEFAGMTVEVQAPIMVFREWHRHRVPFGYSERSARYTPLPDLNYIPSVERIEQGMAATKNRQASGTVEVAEEYRHETADRFRTALEMAYAEQEAVYQESLASGVPKELARLVLPVGRYSTMRATGNLRGWLGFTTLRSAPGAQWEIRQYSQVLEEALALYFPRTTALFTELRRGP